MRVLLRSPILFRFVPCVLFLFCAGCGGEDQPARPVTDTIPPAAIDGPYVISPPGRTITLTWRAPGDDGVEGLADRYEIRYAPDSLAEAVWSSAPLLSSPPEPGIAGTWETYTVSGFDPGVWFFSVRAADEASNWSAFTGSIRASVVDNVPPAAVTDLRLVSSSRTSVRLAWTAAGNDGAEGRAAETDLRFSSQEISAQTFGSAERAAGVPPPLSPGAADSFTVTGLEPEKTYFFALKTGDESGNWSALSNTLTATTISSAFRRITFSADGKTAIAPTWSPDGTQIAFSADWSGNFEIYRVPAEGGDAIRLTDDPGADIQPVWSPVSPTIAFNTDRAGKVELYKMDASDGSNCVFLADEHVSERFWACRPAWSPDGTRIAFVDGDLQMLVSRTSIYTVPAEGGNRQLIMNSSEDWGYFDPSWSPDGTRIAMGSGQGFRWGIWIKTLAGGPQTPLLLSQGGAYAHMAWSPDGSRIAYTAYSSGGADLFLVPAAGGTPVQLTYDPQFGLYPSWSPDGRRLAMALYDRTRLAADVWVLDME